MTESDQERISRAVSVSVVGFVLQLVIAGVLFAISYWSGSKLADSHVPSSMIGTAARLSAFGLPIWFTLFLIFKQQRRVRAEELETEELKRARGMGMDTALFDEVGDEELLIEQSRLKWLVRYFMPATTVVVSLAIIILHFVSYRWSIDTAFEPSADGGIVQTDQPWLMMWFVGGCGFVAFLWARYTLALSRIEAWAPLHAGATWVAANALICLVVAIALMAGRKVELIEPLVACIIRLLLFIIGIEFAVNFVLDLYRPRAKVEIPRPSFDSRLLGLISGPGDIARSIAEAINYQFGFEVSTTWFYKLLQRWLLPLVVATGVVVVLLTSMVIINAEERAVIERFGRPWQADGQASDNPGAREAARPLVLEPGFHWKYFYPIDVVHREPVRRINEIVVGEPLLEEEGLTEEDLKRKETEPILWAKTHRVVPEMLLVVASSQESRIGGTKPGTDRENEGEMAESVAANLLMISVPIEYRIKDITAYLYNYAEPQRVMESIVFQMVSEYAASVDVDQLIGPGRMEFNADLRERLQRRLDEFELGIELAFVGIRGAHPTAEEQVALTYQQVVSAETSMGTMIGRARGKAQSTLTEAAGSVERATALDEAILAKDRLEQDPGADPEELNKAQELAETLLLGDPLRGIAPVGGEAAVKIAEAREKSSAAVTEAANKARQFQAELAGYRASPQLYIARKCLERFEDLPFVRKYLIVGDAGNVIFEYTDSREPGLDAAVLQEGYEKEKKKASE
ncbi:MAG: hypothetical protein JSV78_07815 [Phycisphaerales bacterium]|nr:MAG: hypothetical protein JSV78_07815 [Phycisphaerales bacterium]